MNASVTGDRPVIRAFVDHEHQDLVEGIDRMHEVACDLWTVRSPASAKRVDGVLRWIDGTLRPHMAWEETWLFPTIDDRAQTHWATRLVRFDHRQIAEQADRLRADRRGLEATGLSPAVADLRCDLLRLEALLRASLEREEAFLLPLLDGEARRWDPEHEA